VRIQRVKDQDGNIKIRIKMEISRYKEIIK
jgi:hypothetical protein